MVTRVQIKYINTMKSSILFTAFILFFAGTISASSPSSVDEENAQLIRTEMADLFSEIDKYAVLHGGEDIRICFSVADDGQVRVFKVLWASAELQAAIEEQVHEAHITVKGDTNDLMWMTVKLDSHH